MVAIGETGLDFYRDSADPDEQRRAFSAQLAIAGRAGKPVVIHLRDREGSEEAVSEAFETLAAEASGDVVLHCFSAAPRWAERAAERGWYCSFAGNLTYPSAEPLREAARIVPEDRLLVETDSPFLAPQPVRGRPNQPANVVATAERLAEVRGMAPAELERAVEANAVRVFGWPAGTDSPVVRGSRERAPGSGEGFLADPTCSTRSCARPRSIPGTSCWRWGGGGALTERLAPAVARLHLVELDERLRLGLEPLAAGLGNVNLVWGDAMRLDLAALDPPPTRMVANLPYSIATPLLLRTIAELPSMELAGDGAARDRRAAARRAGHSRSTARRACSLSSPAR